MSRKLPRVLPITVLTEWRLHGHETAEKIPSRASQSIADEMYAAMIVFIHEVPGFHPPIEALLICVEVDIVIAVEIGHA